MASSSRLVLPMIILNMGGEMVNILHQRLHAQNVNPEKGKVVLRDVIGMTYHPEFIEELFRSRNVYNEKTTKQVFYKLAHSSIMRLNDSSMNKLFDLITMGFKYQRTISSYKHLDIYGWVQLKQTLLEALQGRRIKVSLFLQHRVQLSDGTLVLDAGGKLPVGAEIPGTIRYFRSSGEHKRSQNDGKAGDERQPRVVVLPMVSAEPVSGTSPSYLDFDSPLGTNMYAPSPEGALDPANVGVRTPAAEAAAVAVMEASRRTSPPAAPRRSPSARAEAEEANHHHHGERNATAGLNLLASLVGVSSSSPSSRRDVETKYYYGDDHDDDEKTTDRKDTTSTDDGEKSDQDDDEEEKENVDNSSRLGHRRRSSAPRRHHHHHVPFKINLFPDEPFDNAQSKDDDDDDERSNRGTMITIDLVSSSHTGCAKLIEDLDLDEEGPGPRAGGSREEFLRDPDAGTERARAKDIDAAKARCEEDHGDYADLLELMDAADFK